ncbi:MAG TPA: XdhC family protein [Phaeodactylibacter sp.]|nr:XdhC family protein [Phaeodactylibacter sp.]
MKEIKDIIAAWQKLDGETRKVALATVIQVEGSSYRRAGARMLIRDDGQWTGGISGGCLEGDALRKANHCMARSRVEVVRYDTSTEDEEQIGVGLGCEGVIDVLLAPIEQDDEQNPIRVLESCVSSRHPNILLTVIRSEIEGIGAGKMYRYGQGEALSDGLLLHLPKGIKEALEADVAHARATGKSQVKEYGEAFSVFIEVLQPAMRVVLFGSNYDLYPLLRMGRELGWEMDVVMNPARASGAIRELAREIYPKGAEIPFDDYTAFVLMAHDYKTDRDNLLMALQSGVPYIGMLGPVKRRNKSLYELRAAGHVFSEEALGRLYNPVGLDIGALTPEEIALSILAEIKAHFAGRRGQFLRERAGYIHERS